MNEAISRGTVKKNNKPKQDKTLRQYNTMKINSACAASCNRPSYKTVTTRVAADRNRHIFLIKMSWRGS